MNTIKRKTLTSISVVCTAYLTLHAINASAHGFMDFPKARQSICEAQGGYWWPDDGTNIPNLACRAAFLESGYVQFVQEHEFAALIADYNNQAAVEAAIPDGTLCAAGSNEKRGMNLPHKDWQTTDVKPNANGDLAIRFRATTPHNPSFWKFYLSKPTFNTNTDILNWADLQLISEVGNINFVTDPDGKKFYEMTINIPQDRTGRAILYTRWQRNDVAGEGFYNCSDINITSDSQPVNWYSAGFFVKQGQDANAGDTVWARVFNGTGQELVKQSLKITTTNLSNWQEELATILNTNYATDVQVGVKDAAGNISFDKNNLLTNEVYVADAANTYNLTVQVKQPNTPPTVHKPDPIIMNELTEVQLHVHAFDTDTMDLTYTWNVPNGLTYTGAGATISLAAADVTQDTNYTVSVNVSDGELSSSTTAEITVKNVVSTLQPWNKSKTYVAGDKVSHKGTDYEAKWWNRGEEPGTTQVWKKI
ncbi:lytic polysaccharide monooxygenase [Pseudoalteromonas luteoviolacea]|uniref:lytic polysaccharide monooxygenase n=1 Tax=Pseudoalteromonas luteoviolacea TaxID=43657 RepID=UPI001F2322B0|nr:lytic polysaccharide monooxygenase [Pseudoalteromonas luteoviolacea]MCF6442780.1 lytic polysaccharide monooxygenase [Pseudoalteromonas luteoviolacea]